MSHTAASNRPADGSENMDSDPANGECTVVSTTVISAFLPLTLEQLKVGPDESTVHELLDTLNVKGFCTALARLMQVAEPRVLPEKPNSAVQ
jgi:hypothetical protein